MAAPAIAVYDSTTGALMYVGPTGSQRAGMGWTALPTGYSDETFVWNATARQMVDDPAKVGALLIKQVKSIAAAKKMAAMSPGTSKTEEYRLKAPEIAASSNVAAAVLNSLTAANAMLQYPAAATEAKLSGEPLATVLARFRNGAGGSNPEVNRLSAIEQVQGRRIDAATTASAKRAAYAAIDWNWRP